MPALLVAAVLVTAAYFALVEQAPGAIAALVAGAFGWLLLADVPEGPVLLVVAPTHGIHAADVPAVLALGVATVALVRLALSGRRW